jgi:hypothetical protein
VKSLVLEFIGGHFDGKVLRTDSIDQEEVWLAAACYETSHHGEIGRECFAPSCDVDVFAKRHGWATAKGSSFHRHHGYRVTQRRETETEIAVTFEYKPTGTSAGLLSTGKAG